MQFDKYTQRMRYLQELIEKQKTGTPEELAKKLGISRRMLFEYLTAIKENGMPVQYCRTRKRYYYADD
ncbi:MAG: HTH domain-containing protein [Cyclobacteriaceae bacterium]